MPLPSRACHARLLDSRCRSRLVVLAQQQPQPTTQRVRASIPPPPPPLAGYTHEGGYRYAETVTPQQEPQQWRPQEARNSPTTAPADKGLGGFGRAIAASMFILGLGIGTWFDSEVVLTPANISSTEIIDRAVPNADICMSNGYSASVLSMNVFVTYNPFVKGGCVLRRANVGLLEREKLVTPHEVDLCKQRMNTFAYVGDLKTEPEVACVYHSEEAENQYLQVLGSRQQMTQMLLQQPPAPPAAQPT
ncbi:hypothetical protein TSOC_004000 [Tetrabaena socialis]|uniref:Uncharacterized protein n=1 Tax=Tetrabaena socialis TaxID=47790 RepID=A0A2J8AA43_9CHLO|nr:hypothetical protein TSOC_004000 [Tetrabaena socialis]|eukprot:PNH09394.1 hypothetical protein TSOC_004000 [Tetrabaena socialis]